MTAIQSPGESAKRIRIFISSPADVLPEREIADRVIARLDGVWQAHVRLISERWERRHYDAARSFQTAIGDMEQYDVVIGILWKRIGSPLPPDLFQRDDGSSYESGTAFELESAIAASERNASPVVYLLRKSAPVAFQAASVKDEQRQYEAFQAWWDRTTRDAMGHYRRGYQTFADLEEFETLLGALIEGHLRQGALIPSTAAWDINAQGSPYPGLLAYDSRYSAVFFGRALAVRSALEELKMAAGRDAPVLLIVGPSGSGKSSLAMAGLMPCFAPGQIPGVDLWRVLVLQPAPDPVLALSQNLYDPECLPELATGPQATPAAFARLTAQSGDGAAQAVKWGLETAAAAATRQIGGGRTPVVRLLVYVDQLETMIGAASQPAVARFLRAVVECEAAWLIATLRSDRYADLQLSPDFLELRRRSALFDLPAPGQSEIADIISGPAHAAGLTFEEQGGVSLAKIIRAAAPGADALPLLQMTLAGLYEARAGGVLTYAAYQAVGGLDGAIAAHAESVFATLSPAAQATLDSLLQSLVADIDEAGRLTMRTPRLAAPTGSPMGELIAKMTEARLLVNFEGGVRVAHEALLRCWGRAAGSPALQPEAIRLRRQIAPNYALWSKTGLDADLLQPGTALAAAEAIVRERPGAMPADLETYVQRSASAAAQRSLTETRKARRRAYGAGGAAVAFALLAALAFQLYRDASHDFLLALLTRADQFLIEEKPTRALVLAGSLGKSSLVERAFALLGLSNAGSDEAVRINTIAQVAGPASSVARKTFFQSTPANAAAFGADGGQFAIGSADGSATIFSGADGPARRLIGQVGRVWALSFSPDGARLAVATAKDVVLWDVKRGLGAPLCASGGQITDLAYDPAGKYVAWSATDGRIAVWDVEKATLRSIAEHRTWALAVDFSPDGSLLASSSEDGIVVIRRTADWTIFKTLHTGRADLVSLSMRPDGRAIATASLAGPVDVWSLDGEEAQPQSTSISEPADKRWKVKFSPDGNWLAIASWDGTVRLWDGHTLRYRGVIDGNDQRVNGIAFDKTSSTLLTADESGAVRLWDLTAVRPIFDDTPADSREAIVGRYSPDGSKFAAGGKDGALTVYQVDANGEFHRQCVVKHDGWVTSVAFSPDSRRVASVGMADVSAPGENDGIHISDGQNCQPLTAPINVNHGIIRALAYHPSANEIAWSTRAGEIWVAQVGGAIEPVKLPPLHTGGVEEIDFSGDGRLLASAGRDGRVAIWNVADQSLQRVLRTGGPALFTVRFAPNAPLVAAGGAQDQIEVWDAGDAKSDQPVARLAVVGGSNRLSFSADGAVLAVGSDARYISMWSVGRWNKIFQLNALVGVRSVFGFHPIRGDLAFDGENGLVRVLRRREQTPGGALSGVLTGMDVFFDLPPDHALVDSAVVSKLDKSCGGGG